MTDAGQNTQASQAQPLELIDSKAPKDVGKVWSIVAVRAVLGALSGLPFAAFITGPAAELFGAVTTPFVERHLTEWWESIARKLNEHSEHLTKLSPEQLAQSDAFVTAYMRASQIALVTTQEEKLEALRNAVVNAALGNAPDESLRAMFLEAISALTPWHIRLLTCIADPIQWARARDYYVAPIATPDAPSMFEAFYRDQLPVKGFNDHLLKDLYTQGLAANDVDPWGQLFPRSVESTIPHITDLGRQFLTFITDPSLERPAQQPNENAEENA